MRRSIEVIFAEAQGYWDRKQWSQCRRRLEELFDRRFKPAITAAYLAEASWNDGDLVDAILWSHKALNINPNLASALEHLIFITDAQPNTTAGDALALRQRWWDRFGVPEYLKRLPHTNTLDPERVLRIGYVSGDFKFHSACMAFGTVATGHTYQMEPYFYSTLEPRKFDSLTYLWSRELAETWRDVHASTTAELVQKIREDQIDILVDLSGFSEGHRLRVFSGRPAPIQLQGWGYALGAAGPMFDGVLGDAVVNTPDVRAQMVEPVIELPTILSYYPRPGLPEATPLPCLTQPPTFGVFNRAIKVNAEALGVWRQILDRVPESRILFQGFDYSEPIKERIRASLGARRCEFRIGTNDWDSKINYQDVDLCLDPWPQTGGVSTLDALYMHVPVVTLLGPRMIQRTSTSFLAALQLHGCIAQTHEEYIALAVRWVTEAKQELATIRAELRVRLLASPIVEGYVLAVEAQYRRLWRGYCEKAEQNGYTSDDLPHSHAAQHVVTGVCDGEVDNHPE